jgi:ribonuclease Z
VRPTFHPRLVNGPFEDPALFIPFFFEKRALLFDLGDLHRLPPRDMLKITHAFVTHTHMDHFAGFDALLRIFLGRRRVLHLFGPPLFLRNVEAKLGGYTWNLVENYDDAFVLKATEVHSDHTLTQEYHCNKAFSAAHTPLSGDFDGTLLKESGFSVHAIHLDHKIPCLAFMLKERFHVNIMKDRLKALHMPVGPWLGQLKEALYEQRDPGEQFHVLWKEHGKEREATFRLGDLAGQIARVSPGQKIVYIVDVVFTPENIKKMIDLARNATQLFIEAAFLDAEAHLARKKYHLTAEQAGIVARKAGVKHLTLFHFSPRYAHTGALLEKEARDAFTRPVPH